MKFLIAIAGLFGISVVSAVLVLISAIQFNNGIISMDETKKTKLETTKTAYSQCIIKITETNSVAVAAKNDLLEISKAAGSNLDAFSKQSMTWLNTNLMPNLSQEARLNVQKEIVVCRNEYVGMIKNELAPLYAEYNRQITAMPGSLFNMFYGWKRDDLKLPQDERVINAFETGVDKPLELK